jgi:hypothetical protein
MVSLSVICVDDIMLSASQVSGAIMQPSISHLAVIIAFVQDSLIQSSPL